MFSYFFNNSPVIKAALLIAGTCIGGGMLALPVVCSVAGFIPALFVMIISCIFMAITALLYLEATLWLPEKAHMNSLATTFLSPIWKVVCLGVYIFICYASLVAYVSGGGKEISFVFTAFFNLNYSHTFGMIIFTALFGILLLLRHEKVEQINVILFVGMVIAYILLITFSANGVSYQLLNRKILDYKVITLFPIMLTTFSFPGIVPSITSYLNKDYKLVKKAILLGVGITFVIYFLWLFLILGSVSYEGSRGLKEALCNDIPITECLHYTLNNPIISSLAQFFAFFALATSFLGLSLSLSDFYKDCFKSKKYNIVVNFLLCLLIIIPTFLCARLFESAFVSALEISGGIGDAILSGIIPALIVWKGRYFMNKQAHYRVFGGKILLFSIIIFSSFILILEIFRRFI